MGCIKMLRKALIWCKNALYKLQARVKPATESSLFPSDASLASPRLPPRILPVPPAHGCPKDKAPPKSPGIWSSRRTLGFTERRLGGNEGVGMKHHSSILVSSAALLPPRRGLWASSPQVLSNG